MNKALLSISPSTSTSTCNCSIIQSKTHNNLWIVQCSGEDKKFKTSFDNPVKCFEYISNICNNNPHYRGQFEIKSSIDKSQTIGMD